MKRKGLMSVKRMICEFCRTEIGRFDTEKIKLPLSPDMFTSIDERHGIPAPFPAEQKTWMDFRCPVCVLRPMQTEEKISCYDDKGFNDTFIVKIVDNETYECETCGNIYQHESSLIRHRKSHA